MQLDHCQQGCSGAAPAHCKVKVPYCIRPGSHCEPGVAGIAGTKNLTGRLHLVSCMPVAGGLCTL